MSQSPENLICVFCVAEFEHEETANCKVPETTIEKVVAAAGILGRPPSDSNEMKDALSTGRKRAAQTAEIKPGDVCDWALLKYAGGGVEPIMGCVGYPAEARHHGPDKNTLNNELVVNLHKICAYCHNRWHGKNNKHYEEPRPKDGTPWLPVGEWQPHDPDTKVSRQEALAHEMMLGTK